MGAALAVIAIAYGGSVWVAANRAVWKLAAATGAPAGCGAHVG